mgnify:CR=1 FL=1
MEITDLLSKYRKRIEFNYNKQKLIFDTHPSLFSSIAVDKGTFQLINSLRKNYLIKIDKVLDLGCGLGTIGIFLKKNYEDSGVHCVDRDALALEFTKHNARLNNCEIKVYPSLDYSDIKEKFNLICCNYPAKAGINVLKKFVYDASRHLCSEGIFAVVIVKELLGDFKKILRNEIEIVYQTGSSGHYVFHLQYKKEISFDGDPYFRRELFYKLDGEDYLLKTAFNIPEFDSLSFTTQATIGLIKNIKKSEGVCVFEPCQGHLPIAVFYYWKLSKLNLVSRDLLSLKYAKDNLAFNGFTNVETNHKIFADGKFGDLLIWRLDDDIELHQFEAEYEKARNFFKEIIIGGNKIKINRILKHFKLKTFGEKEDGNAKAAMMGNLRLEK